MSADTTPDEPDGHPRANYILNSLDPDERNRLRRHLEAVELPLGKVLFRPGESIEHVFFPVGAMISVVAYTPHGQCAEVGVIGSEGIGGFDVLMGADSTLNEHLIQLGDGAWRVPTAIARKEFERGGRFQKTCLSFARLMMMQISQTALCNRLHSVEERLGRWLLMCRDRSASDDLPLTQEFLSIMLGASRVAVTQSAIALQKLGLIKYSRGHIVITDRETLKISTCDCYKTIKDEYDRYQP